MWEAATDIHGFDLMGGSGGGVSAASTSSCCSICLEKARAVVLSVAAGNAQAEPGCARARQLRMHRLRAGSGAARTVSRGEQGNSGEQGQSAVSRERERLAGSAASRGETASGGEGAEQGESGEQGESSEQHAGHKWH